MAGKVKVSIEQNLELKKLTIYLSREVNCQFFNSKFFEYSYALNI